MTEKPEFFSFFDLSARCDGPHSSARGRIGAKIAGKLVPHVPRVVFKSQSDPTRNGEGGTLRVFFMQTSLWRCRSSISRFAFELLIFERLPFRRFSTDLYENRRTASRHVALDAVEFLERSDLKRRGY